MVLQAHAKEPVEGKYLSLTSFTRDGSAVATPVWFVAENGHLLVETDADSYKVKRIRRDAHVSERVEQLLACKYRIDRFTVYLLYRLVTRLRGGGSRTNEAPVALEITTG